MDTPLKFVETAHLSAVSKSCDYFSRKVKELGPINKRGLLISGHQ